MVVGNVDDARDDVRRFQTHRAGEASGTTGLLDEDEEYEEDEEDDYEDEEEEDEEEEEEEGPRRKR